MRIGIDFDNTIAGYDALFAQLAQERGLFAVAPANKRDLRDALRRQPDGESQWRRLQTAAYGTRMADAELIDGVAPFLNACRVAGVEVHIVSHKTRHASYESDGTDLRRAAMDWMQAQRFFAADNFGLQPEQVHFTDTRSDKVARIDALDCEQFIDDLEEVFAEPGFPARVRGILFDPTGHGGSVDGLLRCRHWDEIRRHVFGRRH